MENIKKELNKLESSLLKELFYGHFDEALSIIKKEEKLLKFNEAAEWLLKDIDSLPLSHSIKKKFADRGLQNISDIIYLKPLRCENYELKNIFSLKDGEYCAIKGSVYSKHITKRLTSLTLKTQEGGFLFCNWFQLTPFIRKRISSLKIGELIVCEGKIAVSGLKHIINHPKIKSSREFQERQEVIYPSASGTRNSTVKKAVSNALLMQPNQPYDYLPYTVISKNKLLLLNELIQFMHKCEKQKEVEYRLKYEEIFLLILGLNLQESRLKKKKAPKIESDSKLFSDLNSVLEFSLTNDQIKTIKEIWKDIKTDKPMLRLLQGDVGCGKTIVALFSLAAALNSGYQAAFMAPTQPLALQIFEEAKRFLKESGFNISLLTGSVKDKEKIYKDIKQGKIDLIVGTHALLEDRVQFKNLGFIVIDEQHRFGVEQRKNLMNKGLFPHVLIMSATPIPRSLSMVLYSKSSLSTIKEKPKGRNEVISMHLYKKNRNKAYKTAINEIRKNHQVYVVAPLIESSEAMQDVDDVETLYEELKNETLKEFRVGLLHGQMKAKDKEKIVDDFKSGKIDCLVSTTVIEVGINSPNATVMIVENAERFGLSQLHQLRGRIGRGTFKSYAIFITKDELSDVAKKRMDVLMKTNDGFEIAQLDYELRGSGEILGIRQHGKDFVYTNIIKDKNLIEIVKKDVDRLMKMHYPINEGLLKIIEQKWQKSINYVYVG